MPCACLSWHQARVVAQGASVCVRDVREPPGCGARQGCAHQAEHLAEQHFVCQGRHGRSWGAGGGGHVLPPQFSRTLHPPLLQRETVAWSQHRSVSKGAAEAESRGKATAAALAAAGRNLQPSRHLWVGCLYNTSKKDIEVRFAKFGRIDNINYLKERHCAFVDFFSKDAAMAAFKAMQVRCSCATFTRCCGAPHTPCPLARTTPGRISVSATRSSSWALVERGPPTSSKA